MEERERDTVSWAQIHFWVALWLMVVVGATATIVAEDLPWRWLQVIAKDLGPALFTAGVLGLTVDRFLKGEFAKDVFYAAFRYVLPNEFRSEISRIMRLDFVAEKHVWTVTVEKVNNDIVCVTTTIERNLKNKTLH